MHRVPRGAALLPYGQSFALLRYPACWVVYLSPADNAVIVAEFYTAISGLGYLIVSNAHAFQTARVFVPVVVLMALGVVTTGLLEVAEARLTPWRQAQT